MHDICGIDEKSVKDEHCKRMVNITNLDIMIKD